MNKCIGFAASLLLSACSSSNQLVKQEKNVYDEFIGNQQLQAMDKIEAFNYWGFMVLDENHYLLSTQNEKSYLVSLEDGCNNLGIAKRIEAVQKEKNKLNVNDRLVRIGKDNEGCVVSAIYKLHQVQMEELSHINTLRRYNSDINTPARFLTAASH